MSSLCLPWESNKAAVPSARAKTTTVSAPVSTGRARREGVAAQLPVQHPKMIECNPFSQATQVSRGKGSAKELLRTRSSRTHGR
jgi:hypothetical protein